MEDIFRRSVHFRVIKLAHFSVKSLKPLDKSAISKGLKWLQGNGDDGTRPEVIFKPKDTIVIFNAKGKDKDYYFVNPSVIFNGSYNDLVYDFCKQKGITIDEYENMVNEK